MTMPGDADARALYVISVAAELAGMHPQTLRIYEAKGLVRPRRTPGNTRLYSEADLERLRLIQRLTGKGVAVTLRPHESATPLFVSLLASWLPFIALIGVWISLSRQMQSGRRWTLTSHNEIDDIKRRLSELQSRIDELINKDKK